MGGFAAAVCRVAMHLAVALLALPRVMRRPPPRVAQCRPGLFHCHAAHLVLRGGGLLLVGLADRVGGGVRGGAPHLGGGLLGSGCCRSTRKGQLTLTAIKPTTTSVAGASVYVGEPGESGQSHRSPPCHATNDRSLPTRRTLVDPMRPPRSVGLVRHLRATKRTIDVRGANVCSRHWPDSRRSRWKPVVPMIRISPSPMLALIRH